MIPPILSFKQIEPQRNEVKKEKTTRALFAFFYSLFFLRTVAISKRFMLGIFTEFN